MTANQKAPEATDYVQYVGQADRRVITKKDWASVGIENQDTVEWPVGITHVPVEQFNEAALAYVSKDPGLKIVTVKN